jgi:isopenicillin-N epimerase
MHRPASARGPADAEAWAAEFLLDPTVTFLNHGSFGACPRTVLAEQQRLQFEMERQPVEWLARRSTDLLAEARAALAAFVGADPDDLVFVPNPTTAVNIVGRSLRLEAGDEVVANDHEYGAMNFTWRFLCGRAGARYVQVPIPVPVTTHDDIVDRIWSAVTSRTRVLFLSHLTSDTALVLPVHELCRRARDAGILTIVDGAHVPAHLPLDLGLLDADVYTGACHKWMCAPKGAAFLWVRREVQPLIEPLVVSWGWEPADPGPSPFIDRLEWQGTRDLSAYLATPAAIDYQRRHSWENIRQRCQVMAEHAQQRFHSLLDQEALSPLATDDDRSPRWFGQMVAIRLPDHVDVADLKRRLYDGWRIEVPVYRWKDVPILRISIQAYTSGNDLDRLAEALTALVVRTRPG